MTTSPVTAGRLAPKGQLTLAALTCLVFFTTSGGAFGLEALIGAVGPGWAVALIVVTPLIWSLPTALMVAELATLMPEEGGYYVWVREALGPFWAVQGVVDDGLHGGAPGHLSGAVHELPLFFHSGLGTRARRLTSRGRRRRALVAERPGDRHRDGREPSRRLGGRPLRPGRSR